MNQDKPAFPLPRPIDEMVPNTGLTKREYFAGLAMQGLVAREGWSERIMEEGGDKSLCIYIAAASIKMADELLKQLSQ